jgi:hypothetical protein
MPIGNRRIDSYSHTLWPGGDNRLDVRMLWQWSDSRETCMIRFVIDPVDCQEEFRQSLLVRARAQIEGISAKELAIGSRSWHDSDPVGTLVPISVTVRRSGPGTVSVDFLAPLAGSLEETRRAALPQAQAVLARVAQSLDEQINRAPSDSMNEEIDHVWKLQRKLFVLLRRERDLLHVLPSEPGNACVLRHVRTQSSVSQWKSSRPKKPRRASSASAAIEAVVTELPASGQSCKGPTYKAPRGPRVPRRTSRRSRVEIPLWTKHRGHDRRDVSASIESVFVRIGVLPE